VKEILNRVTESVGTNIAKNITDTLSETKESIKHHFEDQISKVQDLAENAKDKIADQISLFIEIAPAVETIGFSVEGISVNMSLPPSAVFKFKKTHDIDMGAYEQLLKENSDKLLLKSLLHALISADSCQKKIKMGSFRFSNVEIQLGLSPSVSFQLSPQEN
jgi:hypothetical protein